MKFIETFLSIFILLFNNAECNKGENGYTAEIAFKGEEMAGEEMLVQSDRRTDNYSLKRTNKNKKRRSKDQLVEKTKKNDKKNKKRTNKLEEKKVNIPYTLRSKELCSKLSPEKITNSKNTSNMHYMNRNGIISQKERTWNRNKDERTGIYLTRHVLPKGCNQNKKNINSQKQIEVEKLSNDKNGYNRIPSLRTFKIKKAHNAPPKKRINLYDKNSIHKIDFNRGKIVLLRLNPNESIYELCSNKNCYAAMANNLNAKYIVKIIRKLNLKNIGIGGWDGIPQELVIDEFGNIKNYKNNTSHVLAILKHSHKEPKMKNIFERPTHEIKSSIKPKEKSIIKYTYPQVNDKKIKEPTKESSSEETEITYKTANKEIEEILKTPLKGIETLTKPPIQLTAHELDSIFPCMCTRCERPSPFSIYLTDLQVTGKKVCALTNCAWCLQPMPGLTCPTLKNVYQQMIDCLCLCRADKENDIPLLKASLKNVQ